MARQIGRMSNGKEPKIVNGLEVLGKFIGENEKSVRDLFADAENDQMAHGITISYSMLYTKIPYRQEENVVKLHCMKNLGPTTTVGEDRILKKGLVVNMWDLL
ncbi:hypothetical protein ACFX13_006835 [Malus domestica]